MLFRITLLVLLFTSSFGQQQCSYVTVPVCGVDDVRMTPGRLSAGSRGPKGDPGPPGKMGPRGIPGTRGHKGEDGPKGNAAELDDFKRVVLSRLDELERRFLQPDTCTTSTQNGRVILVSGTEGFCDNGWTVFQHRVDGSVDFYRNWQAYKDGFGNLTGEFWWGLEKVHRITSRRHCRLRIDLRGFDGTTAYAEYSHFSLNDESDNYRLRVAGYRGTAGDSLISPRVHNGMQFTTKDRDNDMSSSNCARSYPGAWWFNSCFGSSLNAIWGRSTGSSTKMIWYSWKGHSESIKESTMKLRCD